MFFCTKGISQRMRDLAYIVNKIHYRKIHTDNPVSDAMENCLLVCMLHLRVLDLWRLLVSFLYSIKEDVVAVDHDSINGKGRKCNLLGWGLKCTLKSPQFQCSEREKRYTQKHGWENNKGKKVNFFNSSEQLKSIQEGKQNQTRTKSLIHLDSYREFLK